MSILLTYSHTLHLNAAYTPNIDNTLLLTKKTQDICPLEPHNRAKSDKAQTCTVIDRSYVKIVH